MGWWKPYNVSGTMHVERREADLLAVIREAFQTEDVGIIGHFTGAITYTGPSGLVLFVSSRRDLAEFYALVNGTHSERTGFTNQLEEALSFANFPYSIVVHDQIINEKKQV